MLLGLSPFSFHTGAREGRSLVCFLLAIMNFFFPRHSFPFFFFSLSPFSSLLSSLLLSIFFFTSPSLSLSLPLTARSEITPPFFFSATLHSRRSLRVKTFVHISSLIYLSILSIHLFFSCFGAMGLFSFFSLFFLLACVDLRLFGWI